MTNVQVVGYDDTQSVDLSWNCHGKQGGYRSREWPGYYQDNGTDKKNEVVEKLENMKLCDNQSEMLEHTYNVYTN